MTENTEQTTETVEQTEQTTQDTAPDTKAENMIPKSRFDQVVGQKNEMAEAMKSLVDELKADIPEDMQDLIPDLKPQDQIKWIRNATKKGLFNTTKADSPASETPGKSNKNVDLDGMSSVELFDLYHK